MLSEAEAQGTEVSQGTQDMDKKLDEETADLLGHGGATRAARLGSSGAVFIMLKSALGAGLLNFPWAFHKAGGVSAAVSVEMVSLVFLVSGLVILGHAASVSGQKTYQGVVRELCGQAIGHLCELCFVFNLFMISVAFLVVVQDQLEKRASEAEMPHHWYTDQHFALFLICLVVILPLSIPKEIRIQKYSSVLGTVAAAYLTAAITVKYYIEGEYVVSVSPLYSSRLCHEASVAIYSSMENRKLSHWVFISGVSMFFCLLIYSLTGIFGYLTFGKDVAADILMSYPGDDVAMIVARLLFGVSIVTIYPITLLLGRSVIQDLLLRCQWHCVPVASLCEKHRDLLLTVTWVAVTFLIAVFVPDISEVISVIGGISAFFIFIFPGLCLTFSPQSELASPWLRAALTAWGAVTLLCGVFIFGQSTATAVMELLNKL
ncbi:putative sodium-coupled neutral amino acid transporter 8 [Arapaima gigas]